MELKILTEENDYLIIDKPACVHSIKSPNSSEPSIADFIEIQFPEYAKSSPKPEDCGLVNRLDFETSGCLVLAKTLTAWEALHKKFINGEVEKVYEAVLTGELKSTVIIESWIGSPNRSAKKVKNYSIEPSKKCRAKYAKTEFMPIRYNVDDDTTLVEVKTKTGRRHQVRVHASEIGHPLKLDCLYSGSNCKTSEAGTLTQSIFFLRCKRISFYV